MRASRLPSGAPPIGSGPEFSWNRMDAVPHDITRHVRDDKSDFRISRGDHQRCFATARASHDGNAVARNVAMRV